MVAARSALRILTSKAGVAEGQVSDLGETRLRFIPVEWQTSGYYGRTKTGRIALECLVFGSQKKRMVHLERDKIQ